MLTAGSLSIEPFGPSRWRLRRTRRISYVRSIVTGPWRRGVRRDERRVDQDGQDARGACDGDARRASISAVRTDLRRTRVRARLTAEGETRARLTRCHRRCRRGARRERADARSAVRRGAWARHSAGTATSAWWCGRRAVRPVAVARRRGPARHCARSAVRQRGARKPK